MLCLFVCFVLATAEAFSLGALRSPRRGGGGVAVLVEGERERGICLCNRVRARFAK